MDIRKETLELAKTTSLELLEEKKSLHDILMTCRSMSKTLQISDMNPWIEFEINGYLVKYKTRDDLYDNLPIYRKTSWKFFDIYGNAISLPPDIMDLFGKSVIYHPVKELESKSEIIIANQFLEKFNKFIGEHGMDYASKSVRIHEAKISKKEINQILEGIKNRIQEFLDTMIAILEID
ncbi:MAG TPA: hypothetical protein VEJ68_05225 [Candidatus Bathyarchaeia archaeon]|nr:hypothetical protein [Candidatus Bathyarchaeia archaeon]